jgi:SAM-dependent methyltransferase
MRAFGDLFAAEQYKFSIDKRGREHREQRHKLGHYHFIGRDMNSVMHIVISAREHFGPGRWQPKFLDCGCGVGNVVMMAQYAGFDAYGIEYDEKTLKRGQRLFKQFRLDPKKLFQGDILEYPDYHKYDVLYGYCPLSDREKEHLFENKLKLDMKVGALLAGIHFRPPGYEEIGEKVEIRKKRAYFRPLKGNINEPTLGIKVDGKKS